MDQEQREDRKRQRKALYIVGGAVVVILFIVGGYFIYNQQQTIQNITAQNEIDKQLLEEEYNELSMQYEGYKFTLENDSLIAKLSSEQAKVQRLMEELKTVKSTNAKRISELRRELETLRRIMRNYVVQIDSLNAANQALRQENSAVKEQISQVSSQRNQLQEEKTKLSKQVELAAKLSASGISVQKLNDRGRTTKRIRNMKQFAISFSIDKNVTAEPGIKTVYMRIYKPDDQLLTKPNGGTFEYEGGNVPYSIAKQIEYEGEPVSMTMYWDIEEFLEEGNYRIEIFADGYLIGRSSFTL